jgi:phosphonate transport system substrate-binding protein
MTQETAKIPTEPSSGSKSGGRVLAYFRALIYMILAATVGIAALSSYQAIQAKSKLAQSQATLVSGMGLAAPAHKHLSSEYTDHDGRLLADPPTDPAALLDPETLVVAYAEDTDDNQQVDWKQFCNDLAKITGKTVVSQVYENSVDDVAAVKAGKIQIVGLHAADAPFLVNTAGFIPVGVLGGKAGLLGNKLDLAVPVSSPIHSLADIQGHTLTCTVPSSITGYRAAVALLMLEAGLRPNVDYVVNFSLKQKNSIRGLAKGEFEAAALSDDKVQSMQEDGKLQSTDFRTIFQSEVIPRLTLGYVYNLKPELAEQIKRAVLNFDNKNGSVDEDGGKPMRFAPVDYKKDFELVRRIDDAFDPRFNAKAATKVKTARAPAPTTAPATT